MEKVAGSYYAVVALPVSTASGNSSYSSSSMGSIERSPSVRGHHSGINKAIEAHRMMVEERQTRKTRRDREFEPMEAQQPTDLVVAQQVTQGSQGADAEADSYESSLIEPAMSQAKTAAVQAFQAQEPDRPFIGEPVPKGSYIDVEA